MYDFTGITRFSIPRWVNEAHFYNTPIVSLGTQEKPDDWVIHNDEFAFGGVYENGMVFDEPFAYSPGESTHDIRVQYVNASPAFCHEVREEDELNQNLPEYFRHGACQLFETIIIERTTGKWFWETRFIDLPEDSAIKTEGSYNRKEDSLKVVDEDCVKQAVNSARHKKVKQRIELRNKIKTEIESSLQYLDDKIEKKIRDEDLLQKYLELAFPGI